MPAAPSVLIIEDDPFIGRVEARIAAALGLQPTVCVDMAEGLRRAAEGGWDLVLLDLNLPDAYGEKLLDAFLSIGELKATPILCVSGDDHATEWIPARAARPSGLGLLRKPFSRPHFEARLRTALGIEAEAAAVVA